MTGSPRTIATLLMLGLFSAAQAETVYVAERVRIGLRAEVVETSPVVKTVETGTPLEVIEHFDKLTRVRDPQGTEGWIEARFLTPDPPARLQLARLQLARLQEDLARSRTQATETQAQLKKAQATVAEQADKIRQLEQQLADKPPLAAAPVAPATPPPVIPAAANTGSGFSYLWLGISFAMLGIGFAAGVRWLRESIRKRSGGMYLRV